MRKSFFVVLSLLCFCFMGLVQARQAASEKNLLGTWAGTWTGGSTGSFEMTITKSADGKLGGSISPKPDGQEGYTVPFASAAFADGKATLKLQDPGGEAEITLVVSADGSALTGTYSVRIKADGNEVDQGAIKATKKP